MCFLWGASGKGDPPHPHPAHCNDPGVPQGLLSTLRGPQPCSSPACPPWLVRSPVTSITTVLSWFCHSELSNLEQVPQPLCASVFSFGKWTCQRRPPQRAVAKLKQASKQGFHHHRYDHHRHPHQPLSYFPSSYSPRATMGFCCALLWQHRSIAIFLAQLITLLWILKAASYQKTKTLSQSKLVEVKREYPGPSSLCTGCALLLECPHPTTSFLIFKMQRQGHVH